MIAGRDTPPIGPRARGVYRYWQGIHWLLAQLAEIGYPRGDPRLQPMVDLLLDMWLEPAYYATYIARSSSDSRRGTGVPILHGRARRCASQHGYALYALSTLALDDPRVPDLARLLTKWQWPDGGWNCARADDAHTSSFMETLTPMRGLAVYGRAHGHRSATAAARRASEVFLTRHLYRRRSNGRPMRPDFQRLHYPLYWHYDILGGLRGLADVGRLSDPRAAEALDWLEARELPDGGWPAERKYYRLRTSFHFGGEFVEWGPVGAQIRNDWVTADALTVLRSAGRLAA
jgi:hypothetical protein